MDYFVRVTLPYDKVSQAIVKLSDQCDKLVVYEHNSNHIHFYAARCQVSTDTIKNYIKRIADVGKAGNKFWSFKTATDDECITYMSKGCLKPVYLKGYTEEDIEDKCNQWEQRDPRPKGLASYVVKETPKEQKRRQWDNIQEIVERYNQLPIKTGRELCRIIKRVVIDENKTMLGRFKLRDYYDTCKAIVNENEWSLSAVQYCEKDYF